MTDFISMIISSISLLISALVAFRTFWQEKPRIKLVSYNGIRVCKYPSDNQPRQHFIAYLEMANIGNVSICLTQLGLFASEKKRFSKRKFLDYTIAPCFYEKDGGLFSSKTLLPSELYWNWIHPKRVAGYEMLIQSRYPNNKYKIGIYAITADGRQLYSLFDEEVLSACRIIILPDEEEVQPNVINRSFPPTPDQLESISPFEAINLPFDVNAMVAEEIISRIREINNVLILKRLYDEEKKNEHRSSVMEAILSRIDRLR